VDRFRARVLADPEPARTELEQEMLPVLGQVLAERELRIPREPRALACDASVERVVGSRRQPRRIDLHPLAGGELPAQRRARRLDPAQPQRRVLDVEIGPVLADACRPPSVGGAVDSLVQRGQRAGVLDQAAAVPEAALLVEAQAALLT